jgi:hypothetical protein
VCVFIYLQQDYIQRLMAEKADLDKRFHGMKDELIQRLQNACTQRDEARAQVRRHSGVKVVFSFIKLQILNLPTSSRAATQENYPDVLAVFC